jgi:hypothetical protein
MSAVIAVPELIAETATDLASIGSTFSEAHIAAATPTIGLVPAAADEVSEAVAHLFSRYAGDYHALAGQAAASQHQFVQNVKASAVSYASAEAANTALLRPLTATADSIGSAIGAFWDQLINMFNAAVGQLTSFWDQFTTTLFQILATLVVLGFFFVLFLLSPLSTLLDKLFYHPAPY